MTERAPFKLWFDDALVAELADALLAVEPRFDRERLLACAPGLDALELKDRVGHIADALHASFPAPGAGALSALVAALPEVDEDPDGITSRGFRFWPFGEYIARYARDDRDAAFNAMTALTQRFTAEFAVRPFLADDLDDALTRLEALVAHPSAHVRRWVSEGTRTRLPWGRGVPALRSVAARRLALLQALHADPSPYVRRSVANHLQDALKDDLSEGWPLLARWAGSGSEDTRRVARHAARGLLKAGHAETLALFGHRAASGVEARFLVAPAQVAAGEVVRLEAQLQNPGDTAVIARVDYRLEGPGARGPTRKVFRWADASLEAGEARALGKSHRFVARSIRPLRAGEHRLVLLVDGEERGAATVWVRET